MKNEDSTLASPVQFSNNREALLDYYVDVRNQTLALTEPLEAEDFVIQTMPDVSPTKWHMAHTTWFFEAFVLSVFDKQYKPYHPQYDHLFNSYYVTHGQPFLRPQRGFLSRPTVAQIFQYRAYVDQQIEKFIASVSESDWSVIHQRIVLGLNHEQQHQELLLTDIKHVLAHNPLYPVYKKCSLAPASAASNDIRWCEFEGGLFDIGHDSETFAYDNEGPVHKAYLEDFIIANRLVTNGEYIEFIEEGGYTNPAYWLSEGWSKINQDNWLAPLYWQKVENTWYHFTLQGFCEVDVTEPVIHVSHYEASAYANWLGKRLPTEFEWEVAALNLNVEGNLRDLNCLKPLTASSAEGLQQMYGDAWEWTASAYTAYPGYKPASGAIGEYNGKFMSGQMVLRGGSFATPVDHIRSTYRNFFYPKDQWQFSGIRLADYP